VPQWAAFLGLTGFVLTAFLALARVSQSSVGETTIVRELPYTDPGVGVGTDRVRVRSSPTPGGVSTLLLLVNVALTQGVFGVVVAFGAFYFEIPAAALGLATPISLGPFPPSSLAATLALGVAFGLFLWMVSESLTRLADYLDVAYDESLRGMMAPESLGGWVALLFVVLPLIAGVEELVFRAAIVGAVSAGFGTSPWALAVVSSVAFALGHGAQGSLGVVVTGLLGLALAAGFVLTGSLLLVVVAHYVVNAVELLVHESAGPRVH
jgi:membrane protease YdiL (CAAX protease family)